MPPREPVRRYHWRAFNHVYGPWHRLIRADNKALDRAEVVIQPDMDRSRYFWYVRLGRRDAPTYAHSGHERTLEEAKRVALDHYLSVT